MTIAVNRNLSNCENSPKKRLSGLQRDPINSINWPASSVWVFIAQLGEHCSANAEATGSNPVEAPKVFFSGYFRNCLNCDSLRWSHTHFMSINYNTSLQSFALTYKKHISITDNQIYLDFSAKLLSLQGNSIQILALAKPVKPSPFVRPKDSIFPAHRCSASSIFFSKHNTKVR